ncbi:MAG: hypothetical protein JW829_13305, partial [Pirellulales bacterium]|nr:hypothetical protein [Pirellulales bacterium]
MTSHEGIAGIEIKVGLTIIAVLVIALCWAVARRFLVSSNIPPAEVRSGAILPTNPNEQKKPIEPRPMVLPPQDRYLGPENYIQPQGLDPLHETPSENYETLDHRPSLLPALPANSQDQPSNPMTDEPSWKEQPEPAPTASASEPSVRSVSHAESYIRSPEILPVDYSQLKPGRKYQVQKGDSLETIAKSELGDPERWPDIHYLNRGSLGLFPTPLQPGIEIVLPAPM